MPTSAANTRRKAPRPDQTDAALPPRRRPDSPIVAEKKPARKRTGVGHQPTSLKLPTALKVRMMKLRAKPA